MSVPARLRRLVNQKANNRCEYCGLSQLGQAGTFHIDHIEPVIAGGKAILENLALACIYCSLHKGARTHGHDDKTGKIVRIFHPRQQNWNHHFRWSGNKIIGITITGRATVDLLQLNSAEHQLIRSFESTLGRHPPPDHL